jgi:hypothetical protein
MDKISDISDSGPQPPLEHGLRPENTAAIRQLAAETQARYDAQVEAFIRLIHAQEGLSGSWREWRLKADLSGLVKAG